MLPIPQINKNVRYRSIIKLLRTIQDYSIAKGLEFKGLELKHFVFFFNKRYKTIMKNWFDEEEYRLPKDIKKEFSKNFNEELGRFDKSSDIQNYLKRLYPYVRARTNGKVRKYYLHNCYDVERLKYAVFEILKDTKKADILNINSFMKDKVVKIDMDGTNILVPTEKLDFT